ncbi:MAG: sensor histidine kinase [Cyanobacteriota bacterium]
MGRPSGQGRNGLRQNHAFWHSLQGQMLLVSVGTIAVVLSLATLSSYRLSRRAILEEHRETIRWQAETISQLFNGLILVPEEQRGKILSQVLARNSMPELKFWLAHADGQVIAPAAAETRHASQFAGISDSQLRELSLNIDNNGEQFLTLGSKGYRVQRAQRLNYFTSLWVIEDTTAYRKFLNRYTLEAATVWGLSLLAGTLAATFLTRRVVQPLRSINRMAASVTPENLTPERLDLQHAPLEVRELSEVISHLLQRLDLGMDQQRQFVNAVSHELRTPLAVLKLYQGRLLHRYDNLHEEQRRILGISMREVERMNQLLNDLLDLSRREAGQLPLAATPVNLAALIEEVAASASEALERPVQAMLLGESPQQRQTQQWQTLTDGPRLRQVLLNLVENAHKYSPSDAPIQITLRSRYGQMELGVHDRGIGIPSEELPRVFERFFRSSTAGAQAGSGLGLFIVHSLVTSLGGTIAVENRPGGGSSFVLSLPIREAAVPAATADR